MFPATHSRRTFLNSSPSPCNADYPTGQVSDCYTGRWRRRLDRLQARVPDNVVGMEALVADKTAENQQASVAVVLPIYNQTPFLRRALASLQAQTYTDWHLVVVDDGSTDPSAIAAILHDLFPEHCYTYRRLVTNHGLGAALNIALAATAAPYIAYLPADDLYYPDHLASLLACLEQQPAAILAYSGVRHHSHDYAHGQISGLPLQLVQTLHRRTVDRWVERTELVTDDLERLYWGSLRHHGSFVGTHQLTAEWVAHPEQRNRIIRESLGGGLNRYRRHYQIAHPLRFQSSEGDLLDEGTLYRRFRDRPDTPRTPDSLKILLVGELAFNPERILALEERGHQLFGLWTPDGVGFNTVGPLPFGHVTEIPLANWQEQVRQVQPDVIYALLNWHAVPFAHQVLLGAPDIPFVWHFKESPFACLERGMWPQLVDLHLRSDAQIYTSPEMLDWYDTVLPGQVRHERALVIDGDLPKADWFTQERSERLSQRDGEIHTAVSGRPFGIHPETIGQLAQAGIHMHFYGPTWGDWWSNWIAESRKVAPRHLHLEGSVLPPEWVRELSQYDAGWLHIFTSHNAGEIRRANWDDMNYPARLGTLLAAGLPLIQPDHGNAIVATQALSRRLDIGLTFRDAEDLAAQLRDTTRLAQLRENAWGQRSRFCFDTYADQLITLFRQVISAGSRRSSVG